MSASYQPPALPTSAITWSASTRTRARIAALKRGEIPIFEPGLSDLVANNVRQGRLEFASDLMAVTTAEAVFIAVGTPSRRGDGHADLSFVYEAVREIAPLLCDTAVIVTKSTVPVGTGDEIERILRERRPDVELQVVSNPEFLREGAAIQDFKHPDRIVVGTDDPQARALLAEIYRPLYLNAAPILYVGRRTAELIKYASNAFLATKITFINEMADLCESIGADVQDVARGMGLDNRIGAKFLHAGPGFGGSCFPKDTTALLKTAHDHGAQLRIVETVVGGQRAAQTRNGAQGDRRTRRPDPRQDDCRSRTDVQAEHRRHPRLARDSPDYGVAGHGCAGARLRSGRHVAARQQLPDITYCDDAYAAADGAEALVIATEREISALDLQRLRRSRRGRRSSICGMRIASTK